MNGACAAAAASAAICAAGAAGQMSFVINDRITGAIWRVADLNANGVIEQPGELRLWFSAVNAAGTVAPVNPSALGTRPDGLAIMGDQGLGAVLAFCDLNADADAQDSGESLVAADANNASGALLTFPTAAAFDGEGRLYVVNAGNTSGPDVIYRLIDSNADDDFQDAGEIGVYVGDAAFGAGNGPYSPQEVVFLPGGGDPVGLLRNSSGGLHGVYRFADGNGNGRADDAGEFTVYFDAANQSGIAPSSGFGLEPDAARPGSVYMLQTATGSLDQLLRLTDGDGSQTAQQAGEAVLVWESVEPNFINIDVVSLADGRVLVTDSSSDRVIVLKDNDGDDRFMSAGERGEYYTNAPATLGDLRQMAPIPFVCYPDCNHSGTLTVADFGCFQTIFVTGKPYVDCNGDGLQNVADFGCFQTRFVVGCP